jgi:hypothetical protein
VFPPAIIGEIVETNPINAFSWGAIAAHNAGSAQELKN